MFLKNKIRDKFFLLLLVPLINIRSAAKITIDDDNDEDGIQQTQINNLATLSSLLSSRELPAENSESSMAPTPSPFKATHTIRYKDYILRNAINAKNIMSVSEILRNDKEFYLQEYLYQCPTGTSTIINAVKNSTTEIVKLLIDNEFDIYLLHQNAFTNVDPSDEVGLSALEIATKLGFKEKAELIKAKKDANSRPEASQKDKDNELFDSIRLNDTVRVKLLISSGANIKSIKDGKTCIQTAKTLDMLKLLNSLGADIDESIDCNITTLVKGFKQKDNDRKEFQFRDINRMTALMKAVYEKDNDRTRLLIDAGADPYKSVDGMTVGDIAYDCKYNDIFSTLEDALEKRTNQRKHQAKLAIDGNLPKELIDLIFEYECFNLLKNKQKNLDISTKKRSFGDLEIEEPSRAANLKPKVDSTVTSSSASISSKEIVKNSTT